mmetsp:Transcript_10836/g.35913  ORF Transcript_10836/g.35913 Transcript_10836/m.35913 type:complete len:350 (-) Transcript_10836:953-2002(-)
MTRACRRTARSNFGSSTRSRARRSLGPTCSTKDAAGCVALEEACFKAAAAVQLARTPGFARLFSTSSSSSCCFGGGGNGSVDRRSRRASSRAATAAGAMGAKAPRQSATMALVGSPSASADLTRRSATRSTKGARALGSAAEATSFVAANRTYSSSSAAPSRASRSGGKNAATDPDATRPRAKAADVLWSLSSSDGGVIVEEEELFHVVELAAIRASKAAGDDARSTRFPSSPRASVASRTRAQGAFFFFCFGVDSSPLTRATSSSTLAARWVASASAHKAARADAALASICLSALEDAAGALLASASTSILLLEESPPTTSLACDDDDAAPPPPLARAVLSARSKTAA